MGEKREGNWSGQVLAGRYRLGHKLGRGGVGVVYEAVQQNLKRRVAVKLLHPHLAHDQVYLERFRREAQSAGGLGHPNIVGVTDFQHREGEPAFLVMEYLEGRTLEEELRAEGPMSPERVSFIAQQVLSALSAAHAAGIVHRDLKPGNIFLTSVAGMNDIVKILDFGVAKVARSESGTWTSVTATGETLGTPSYMAPEQATGSAVDGRTDLFTLGVVMYRAITGRLPFDGPNPAAQLQAVVHERARRLRATMPRIDPRVDDAVHRALQKRKEDRFPDAEAMKAALEAETAPQTDEMPPDEEPVTIDEQTDERTADIRPPVPGDPAQPPPVAAARDGTGATQKARPPKRPQRPRKPTLLGVGVGGADWEEESTDRLGDPSAVHKDLAKAAREPEAAERARAQVLAGVPSVVESEEEETSIDPRPAAQEIARMRRMNQQQAAQQQPAQPQPPDDPEPDPDVDMEMELGSGELRELPDSEPPTRPLGQGLPDELATAPSAAPFMMEESGVDEPPPVPQAPTPASVRSKGSRAGRIALWSAAITAAIGVVGGLAAWRWLGDPTADGATASRTPVDTSTSGAGGDEGTGSGADPSAGTSTAVTPTGGDSDGGAEEGEGAAATDAGAAEPALAGDAGAAAEAEAGAGATVGEGDDDEPQVELPEVPRSVERLSDRRRSIVATRLRTRGNRYYARRRYARAEELYRKSLQYSPESAASALGMARALTRQGKSEEALAWARRSERLQPERSLTHIVLGDLLRARGEMEEAQHHYEEAVRIQPRNRVARKRLWRIKRR